MTNERIDDRVRFGWLCSYTPLEILAAAGLTPVRMDAGSEESYTADRMGYAVDTCSAHRAALGAEELGLYPHADLLISTTHFCDGKPKCNEIFKEKYEIPFHLIDIPLRSIAEWILDSRFIRPVEESVKAILDWIEDFQIDGVVSFTHLPCRQGNGALYWIKEHLTEKGIVFMDLQADICDPSTFSQNNTRMATENYIEIMT